jgi:uncharacterized repeat protein (TIGR03803 family)
LVEGTDGALYGTTFEGGLKNSGTVFRINKDGSAYMVVRSFNSTEDDGINPFAGLINGGDGMLYGTTLRGGEFGIGTVFSVAPAATLGMANNGDLTITAPSGTRYTVQYLDALGGANGWQEFSKVTIPSSGGKIALPAFATSPSRIYRARLDP